MAALAHHVVPTGILWESNVAMENGPLVDDLPIKNLSFSHVLADLRRCKVLHVPFAGQHDSLDL